jgi:hypothetical protein
MSADSVPRAFFSDSFAVDGWNVYRTRFLVRATRLAEPFIFTDALGREQQGQAGDYLVESSEGMFRIAPREVFEDVYVPLEPGARTTAGPLSTGGLQRHSATEAPLTS